MNASRAQFDAGLIRRYDVNGPRYTSYPTANLFQDGFAPDDYTGALARLAGTAPALSLYLHVPFCATVCYYCACNRIITNNRRHAVAYLQRLEREIAMVRARLPDAHRIEQLHFGGGTPTYLDDEQLCRLFEVLGGTFAFATETQRDFSIEIDPRTVDPARIEFLAGLGLNRISLGVQDFDPAVQAAVNRIQGVEDTRRVIEAARRQDIRSVSIDLIYGLPLQTLEGFARTLEIVLELAPDRISLYSYAHLPQRFKTQRQIRLTDLPAAETKLGLLESAVATLCGAGYRYIGMDHFARADDSLVAAQADGTLHRNFQGYTTHGHCDLIGLGVSAISHVGSVYAQNAKTLDDYYRAIDAGRLPVERGLTMTGEDHIRHDLIERLMCHFEVDLAAFSARHGIDFRRHFATELARLAPLARDGLVRIGPSAIEVTPRGRFLIRNVCMVFDAYLGGQQGGFSKAI
jgi:oxygen-independent coproporphyrinogen III oxidase